MYTPSPSLVLIQARADYEDHLRRFGYDDIQTATSWNELHEDHKNIYIRRAEGKLIATLGSPTDAFIYKATAPWALPVLNWLARSFDKLGNRIQKKGPTQ